MVSVPEELIREDPGNNYSNAAIHEFCPRRTTDGHCLRLVRRPMIDNKSVVWSSDLLKGLMVSTPMLLQIDESIGRMGQVLGFISMVMRSGLSVRYIHGNLLNNRMIQGLQRMLD